MDVLVFVFAYIMGIATWALVGYVVSLRDQGTPVVTREEIAEAIEKALK